MFNSGLQKRRMCLAKSAFPQLLPSMKDSMGFMSRAAIAAISFLNAYLLLAESPLVLPNATVGSNLEAPAKIKLGEPATSISPTALTSGAAS
jgi:hypothetical protein